LSGIIIEHLEEGYSKWLIYEYINAAKTSGCRVIYTNIRDDRVARILSRYGEVHRGHAWEIFPRRELVILDPKARVELSPLVARDTYLIIGGILGDDPPRGRTRELLTQPLGLPSRHLGREQLTIDGAAYVACQIKRGTWLYEIEFIDGLVIHGEDHEVYLPYRYPLVNGEPLISPVIRRILEVEGVYSEYWLGGFQGDG